MFATQRWLYMAKTDITTMMLQMLKEVKNQRHADHEMLQTSKEMYRCSNVLIGRSMRSRDGPTRSSDWQTWRTTRTYSPTKWYTLSALHRTDASHRDYFDRPFSTSEGGLRWIQDRTCRMLLLRWTAHVRRLLVQGRTYHRIYP